MDKDEIIQFLKENLTIECEESENAFETTVDIKISLNMETISKTEFTINKE